MASVVGICNRALSKLGAIRITSLEDESKEARACSAAYEDVRDAVLRDHPWNCATVRASLAKLAAAPDWGFANQYQWPADCLGIHEVDTTLAWKVEGRRILTDAGAPLRIRYAQAVTDPNQFDAAFREALAARLATEMAEELTQSRTVDEKLARRLARQYARAKIVDGQEGTPDTLPEDSWIEART